MSEDEPQVHPTDDQMQAGGQANAGTRANGGEQAPLRSVHTSNFPAILKQFGMTLLVTTYQAGKLVFVRPDRNVEAINTHFRTFNKPMGLAIRPNRIAVGTAQEIWEFHNVPAVSGKLDPPDVHDACFLPRWGHFTGDIQIHEMSFCGNDLWFVNTRFSCLCTNDGEHSFVPRWWPKFITHLNSEDRCHLNGLATIDGKIRYVTALGATNEPGGWREDKKGGGVLIDVDSNEFVLRGLSMPHSPRWYADRLWLLESGNGSLGYVDGDRFVSIAKMPGFTRGLCFAGNLAFVGLSQVRETAVFSGLKITEDLKEEERTCGVWVIDIRNGNTVAFLKFEDAVQEVFEVAILDGMQYPDLINDKPEITGDSFVLPDEALKYVPGYKG